MRDLTLRVSVRHRYHRHSSTLPQPVSGDRLHRPISTQTIGNHRLRYTELRLPQCHLHQAILRAPLHRYIVLTLSIAIRKPDHCLAGLGTTIHPTILAIAEAMADRCPGRKLKLCPRRICSNRSRMRSSMLDVRAALHTARRFLSVSHHIPTVTQHLCLRLIRRARTYAGMAALSMDIYLQCHEIIRTVAIAMPKLPKVLQ